MLRIVVVFIASVLAAAAAAAELEVQVLDADDAQPLADAVISLHPASGAPAVAPGDAVVDQRDSTFVPHVLAVTRGSRVRFPNSDNVLHQVYSFSEAKRFELPLYSGQPPKSVHFPDAGVVALGCNIHDQMSAFIVVLDTPYHAVTDADGRARIKAPAGDYRLETWHERLQGGQAVARPLRVDGTQVEPVEVSLALAPPPPPRIQDPRLRALQDRFRSLKNDRR
ncbi:methylamine utilization protein [Coralloluteibacterium stylophorae]|uniref:Methylamine utilization protein n=1 Tax=Coralloluteibacterium stylophorae TaxID=1776034 RepID=A0AAP2G0I4_9GAMM|nr:methylamine utilization protein [Coralloluteibacterium stylophorae]MBS7457606.1 methylamine utilization protein [Coralloluteibacterium stylophorae]